MFTSANFVVCECKRRCFRAKTQSCKWLKPHTLTHANKCLRISTPLGMTCHLPPDAVGIADLKTRRTEAQRHPTEALLRDAPCAVSRLDETCCCGAGAASCCAALSTMIRAQLRIRTGHRVPLTHARCEASGSGFHVPGQARRWCRAAV